MTTTLKLSRADFFGCITLILIVFIVYSQVVTFEFINFDDNVYLTENEQLLKGISLDSLLWAFTTTLGGHWHPLTWISHLIDVTLFGLSPKWHHFENVLFHALNSSLAFLLLRLGKLPFRTSFIAAALFALHPLRLESVAWAAERKDVLSMFFCLISGCLAIRFISSRHTFTYALALTAYVLALLAKPTVVPLPFLLFLFEIWPYERFSSAALKKPFLDPVKSALLEKVPFLLLSVLSAISAIAAQSNGGGLRGLQEVSFLSRLEGIPPGYLAYLGKLFWPSGLGIFYPRMEYPPGIVSGALLSLLALTAILIIYRKRAPYLLVAWIWFLVALLPVSGIIAVGGQSFADRWTYLPHLLPIAALVQGSFSSCRTARAKNLHLLSWLGGLLCCAVLTFWHLPKWRTSETVFTHLLEVSPNNFIGHTNLGVALLEKGRIDEAGKHFEEAVRLNPTYPEALNNVGIYRIHQGRFLDAIGAFEKAVTLRPDFQIAQKNLWQARAELNGLRGQMK